MSWPRVFSLIACNFIWAVQPVFVKIMLQEVTPLQVAWLRLVVASFAYLLLMGGLLCLRKSIGRPYIPRGRVEWTSILVLGLVPFALAPLLQSSGIASSQAVDGVLIVAMEPIISVVLAWVILREAIGLGLVSALAISLAGFVFLSAGQELEAASVGAEWPRWQANLIILLSVTGEGIYSIAGRKLVKLGIPSFGIFGTGVIIGASALTLALAWRGAFPDLAGMGSAVWFGAFWMGALGTTFGYAWWLKLLETEKVGTLVISLFLQPAVGSIAGVVYLDEHLMPGQWMGAVLILTGVLFAARFSALRQE